MSLKLTVERMVELEFWLVNNRLEVADRLGALSYFLQYYNEEESNYLVDAFFMPYQEVRTALVRYDNSHPKMDELIFLADLQSRFSQNSNDVLRRIREVRRIVRYLSKNPTVEIPGNDECVVHDEELEKLIKLDSESTYNLQGALTYDDREKALIEKMRILRKMAEFNGLTLDDLARKENYLDDKGNKLVKDK